MSKACVEVAILAHRRLRRLAQAPSAASHSQGTEVSDTTIPPALVEPGLQRSPEPREQND